MPVSESFTLRPAVAADFPSIRRLIFRVGINPTGLDWRRFVVAISSDGTLVGCGQIKTRRDGTRELASIAVQPEWQGRGVGRSVIEHLLASSQGELYLTCRARLGPYYEKFCFEVVSEAGMPPHFRRIARLARLLGCSGLIPVDLLVMKRQT